MAVPADWAPEACTLPTEARPLRVAEFDDLFSAVQRSSRQDPTQLELVLPAEVQVAARDLARRESQCCSFFSFDCESAGAYLVLRIGVPGTQVEVLDAIESRIASI
jgi:hypothetical protein